MIDSSVDKFKLWYCLHGASTLRIPTLGTQFCFGLSVCSPSQYSDFPSCVNWLLYHPWWLSTSPILPHSPLITCAAAHHFHLYHCRFVFSCTPFPNVDGLCLSANFPFPLRSKCICLLVWIFETPHASVCPCFVCCVYVCLPSCELPCQARNTTESPEGAHHAEELLGYADSPETSGDTLRAINQPIVSIKIDWSKLQGEGGS